MVKKAILKKFSQPERYSKTEISKRTILLSYVLVFSLVLYVEINYIGYGPTGLSVRLLKFCLVFSIRCNFTGIWKKQYLKQYVTVATVK